MIDAEVASGSKIPLSRGLSESPLPRKKIGFFLIKSFIKAIHYHAYIAYFSASRVSPLSVCPACEHHIPARLIALPLTAGINVAVYLRSSLIHHYLKDLCSNRHHISSNSFFWLLTIDSLLLLLLTVIHVRRFVGLIIGLAFLFGIDVFSPLLAPSNGGQDSDG